MQKDNNSQAPQEDKRTKEWTSEPSRLSTSYKQEFRHQFSGSTRQEDERMDIRTFQRVDITHKNSDINSQAQEDRRTKEWTSEPSRLSTSCKQEFRHQFSGTTRQEGEREDIRTFQTVYIIYTRIQTSILRHRKTRRQKRKVKRKQPYRRSGRGRRRGRGGTGEQSGRSW